MDQSISEIVCLVRGKDSFAAHERVNKSLLQRGKTALSPEDDRIKCLTARLGEKRLELSSEQYQKLANRATIIIHVSGNTCRVQISHNNGMNVFTGCLGGQLQFTTW